jgi:hypothetical protein
LYDWLVRFNESQDASFVDQAEERVLFDLESVLEKILVAPLKSNYTSLLAAARSKVRDEIESHPKEITKHA